jgi:hypothetical protein
VGRVELSTFSKLELLRLKMFATVYGDPNYVIDQGLREKLSRGLTDVLDDSGERVGKAEERAR